MRSVDAIRKVFIKLERAAANIKDYDHQFTNPYFAIKYVNSVLSAGVVKNKVNEKANELSADHMLGTLVLQ